MKVLVMSLFLLSLKVQASGCDYHDLYLLKEEPVYKIGENSATLRCESYQCWITTDRIDDGAPESHTLSKIASSLDRPASTTVYFPKIDVYVYRQVFGSSCFSEYVRYVVGTDYKEERYRSEKDLTAL